MKKIFGYCLGKPESITWDKLNNKIIERKDLSSFDQDGEIYYQYYEYHYSIEEYLEHQLKQIGANVDYISMMTEVDL